MEPMSYPEGGWLRSIKLFDVNARTLNVVGAMTHVIPMTGETNANPAALEPLKASDRPSSRLFQTTVVT
jgi:hypothetical protein